jgi:hypothetical protein
VDRDLRRHEAAKSNGLFDPHGHVVAGAGDYVGAEVVVEAQVRDAARFEQCNGLVRGEHARPPVGRVAHVVEPDLDAFDPSHLSCPSDAPATKCVLEAEELAEIASKLR